MRRFGTTVLVIALAAPLARAAGPERLDTLEIRATPDAAPRTGEVVTGDHVGTHSRIDGETLERRDVGLGELVAREAGVQGRVSGGFGSFSTVTVRAASPAQSAIHLDGVRLNSAGDPVVDLSTLELLSLDAVDVYRGAVPLQLGSGSIGGAVNLITPAVRPGADVTRLLGGVASFGTARAEVAHRGTHGRLDVVAALGGLTSDNDFEFVDGNATPLNPDDDRRERRNNAGVDRLNGLVKLGTEHSNGARTDALLQAGTRELGVPEWRNARDDEASFDTDTLQLQLTHRRGGPGDWRSSHTAFAHATDNRYDDRLGQVGLGRQLTDTRARTLGLDGYWERPLGAGLVELQYELRRETLSSDDELDRDAEVEAARLDGALSAQWSWFSDDDRFVVVPGLNLRAVEDDVDRRASSNAAGAGERGGRAVSPRLGLRADLSERLGLYANVGRFEREPSFAELFVDRGLVRGNPNLDAERGNNAEVGLSWTPRPALALEAAVFGSRRDELIATVYDARGVGRAINVGEARIAGLELSAAWSPVPAVRLSANATLQDTDIVSDNARLDGRQIPGEARRAFHARVGWTPHPRWRTWLEAEGRDERYYDSANARRADDVLLGNAGIDWTGRRLSAAFTVHNLGDDVVEDYNGFPRPGRACSLNLTYTFQDPPA